MAVPIAFSSEGKDIIEQGEVIIHPRKKAEGVRDVVALFDVDGTVDFIASGGFSRVALQFPDEHLDDAAEVMRLLQKRLPTAPTHKDGISNPTEIRLRTQIFLLADTSYGSCCVDEVAALHLSADAIVHYGRTCLSSTARLPVYFVFVAAPLDRTGFVNAFKQRFVSGDKVLVLADVSYQEAVRGACALHVAQEYPELVIASIRRERRSRAPAISGGGSCSARPEAAGTCCAARPPHEGAEQNGEGNDGTVYTTSSIGPDGGQVFDVGGRTFSIPHGEQLSAYTVCFVGPSGPTVTNLLLNLSLNKFASYNPENGVLRDENRRINKSLMQRYAAMEKVKDANIIGIIVGTLGVEHYLDVISKLKAIIKAAGRKQYTFVVGKINVPKLANFSEVDVFVLVACPENTLLAHNSRDFYAPIVTPFEVEMAFCGEWTGRYSTEFKSTLASSARINKEVEEVRHSLINNTLTDRSGLSGDNGALVVRASGELAVAPKNASEYLAGREYQGLQPRLGETAVSKAVRGQEGIAMGYSSEPQPQ